MIHRQIDFNLFQGYNYTEQMYAKVLENFKDAILASLEGIPMKLEFKEINQDEKRVSFLLKEVTSPDGSVAIDENVLEFVCTYLNKRLPSYKYRVLWDNIIDDEGLVVGDTVYLDDFCRYAQDRVKYTLACTKYDSWDNYFALDKRKCYYTDWSTDCTVWDITEFAELCQKIGVKLVYEEDANLDQAKLVLMNNCLSEADLEKFAEYLNVSSSDPIFFDKLEYLFRSYKVEAEINWPECYFIPTEQVQPLDLEQGTEITLIKNKNVLYVNNVQELYYGGPDSSILDSTFTIKDIA